MELIHVDTYYPRVNFREPILLVLYLEKTSLWALGYSPIKNSHVSTHVILT